MRHHIPMDFFLGSEIYQETLAKALAKHFGAKLLIVDSLLLPGVSFFDVCIIYTFKVKKFIHCFLGIILLSFYKLLQITAASLFYQHKL